MAPRTVEKVPASHLMHEDMFSAGLYVPIGHWVHEALPGRLKVPAGQMEHTELLMAPTSSEKLPPGQSAHVSCCSSGLKDPAGHGEQDELPGLLYSPMVQGMHTSLALAPTSVA